MQRKNARCLGEYSAPAPSNPNLGRAERARNANVELTVNVGARGAPDVVESPRQMAAQPRRVKGGDCPLVTLAPCSPPRSRSRERSSKLRVTRTPCEFF